LVWSWVWFFGLWLPLAWPRPKSRQPAKPA